MARQCILLVLLLTAMPVNVYAIRPSDEEVFFINSAINLILSEMETFNNRIETFAQINLNSLLMPRINFVSQIFVRPEDIVWIIRVKKKYTGVNNDVRITYNKEINVRLKRVKEDATLADINIGILNGFLSYGNFKIPIKEFRPENLTSSYAVFSFVYRLYEILTSEPY